LRDTNYYYNAMSLENGILYSASGSFTTVNTLILNTIDAFYVGTWMEGSISMPGIYGSYFNDADTTQYNPTASATYSPSILTPGLYNVFTWYPTNSTFSTNTQMFVSGATNEIIRSVNQTANGGSWQQLVTNLYFATGMGGNVVVYNDTGETNKLVVANAMKWSYVASQDYPSNGVPPAWWTAFYANSGAAVSNYADYVFGMPPNSNPTNVPNFWVGPAPSNAVTVSFAPYQGGRLYQLQSTTNLSAGQWLTLTNQPLWQTNGAGYGVFTITESNALRCFYRLSASVVAQ